jgi:hypothetical protein
MAGLARGSIVEEKSDSEPSSFTGGGLLRLGRTFAGFEREL